MSIDAQREQEDKVREDLNRHSGFCDACEGQALALRLRRRAARATVMRGPVPRNRSLILDILHILAILFQTRERLRSSRTFSPCCSDGIYRH